MTKVVKVHVFNKNRNNRGDLQQHVNIHTVIHPNHKVNCNQATKKL